MTHSAGATRVTAFSMASAWPRTGGIPTHRPRSTTTCGCTSMRRMYTATKASRWSPIAGAGFTRSAWRARSTRGGDAAIAAWSPTSRPTISAPSSPCIAWATLHLLHLTQSLPQVVELAEFALHLVDQLGDLTLGSPPSADATDRSQLICRNQPPGDHLGDRDGQNDEPHAHGPHGDLKHARSPSRPSHVTYRARSRARAPRSHGLAARPAGGTHSRDGRFATVRRGERAPDLLRDLRLTRPFPPVPLPQQHQHRAAPARSREPRAQRARPTRRGDHEVELRRATLVQAPARLVRLVQELPEPPHVSPGQQLGPEPGAGGLPHDVQRARAQRLGEGALEARQPARGPAGEPHQLPQLEPPPGHRP